MEGKEEEGRQKGEGEKEAEAEGNERGERKRETKAKFQITHLRRRQSAPPAQPLPLFVLLRPLQKAAVRSVRAWSGCWVARRRAGAGAGAAVYVCV